MIKCKDIPVNHVDVSHNFSITDKDYLIQWISDTGELPQISGIKTTQLTLEELDSWIETSDSCAVITHDSNVVGIATLSTNEAELPEKGIELCHCIVRPTYRRIYKGTSLLLKLIDIARQDGYQKIYGRVCAHNNAGHGLIRSLGFIVTNNISDDPTVVWYEKLL